MDVPYTMPLTLPLPPKALKNILSNTYRIRDIHFNQRIGRNEDPHPHPQLHQHRDADVQVELPVATVDLLVSYPFTFLISIIRKSTQV